MSPRSSSLAPSAHNISSRLSEKARRHPDKPAVIFRGRSQSFGSLENDCARIAAGLEDFGIGRGVRTALMVPPSPDFFALAFGLLRVGAVPVFIDPGMGLRSVGKCLEEAGPDAFIGIPLAHAARRLLGWSRGRDLRLVTVGRRWLWGGTTLEDLRKAPAGPPLATAADDAAAILFTSGSTGPPKGALYTHGIFSAQTDFLRDHFGISEQDVSLPTFPLFALFDVALGMTAIIPEMDFSRPGSVDPRKILGPIREFGVTQLFGSPALLDRVSRCETARKEHLASLKRVISAGAPVPPRIISRLVGLLPHGTQVHTPYGATESLPVCSIASREILGETAALSAQGYGTCVGRPVKGMEVRIIKISDEPIEEWSDSLLIDDGGIGEIVVAGPVVTREYYNLPAATRLAKIAGGRGKFYHRMGDLGYRDSKGRIWFCGRKAHRVTTAEGTLFSVCCEGVFNVHNLVRRTALVGVGPQGDQKPVLCVEARETKEIMAELLELAGQNEVTRSIRTVLFKDSFPVDTRHNSKIFREKLALWAAKRLK